MSLEPRVDELSVEGEGLVLAVLASEAGFEFLKVRFQCAAVVVNEHEKVNHLQSYDLRNTLAFRVRFQLARCRRRSETPERSVELSVSDSLCSWTVKEQKFAHYKGNF